MATPPGTDLDDAPRDGTRMTVGEFVALLDAPRAELVDGVFRRVPLGGPLHARTNARLAAHLASYVLARNLGAAYDCSVAFILRLDPPLARSPDVSFVRRGKDDSGDSLDGGDVIPEFSVPLAFLFEDLAPPD